MAHSKFRFSKQQNYYRYNPENYTSTQQKEKPISVIQSSMLFFSNSVVFSIKRGQIENIFTALESNYSNSSEIYK